MDAFDILSLCIANVSTLQHYSFDKDSLEADDPARIRATSYL